MTRTKIDVRGLYGALDAERTTRGLSWRQLAKEVGVSPSLLSRLGNDLRPDADGFATLVRWLNMPAEQFMIDTDRDQAVRSEPDLVTQLTPLLRARRDLDKRDIAYLEDVIRATVRHVQASREGLE
ncbi:helix-turn-helix transcriptional regulator [Rhodococcus sp. NBC_00297]|uniref:helix-turn-helix transcriptional regulator n=1 Tax=Rhodococcus sp. NBC_00297 TaxID=2976005 RepID=UPI002E2CF7C3|nr:helix-turn-helix transcriptional regulator [Rhodococcus sp. NBC_00297]